jgi:hypothetical protein
MSQLNKAHLLNRSLYILLFMLVFSACQKSIDTPADVMEIATSANISKGNGVKPYKFERINVYNFSSQGWRKQQVNNISTGQLFSDESEYVKIVCGPENNSDPRLIPGSITMNLPTSADATLRRIRLRKEGYSGTLLADLTELKYSTYVVQNCPTIIVLQIDVNGDATNEFNIYYEPRNYRQSPGFPHLVLNTWQQWDPLNQGIWHIEFSTVPLPGGLADNVCTLQELVAGFPNARIIDTPPVGHSGEGLRFTIGGNPRNLFDNTIGYFDALIIGTKDKPVSTLYDFMCDQSGN